MAEHGYYLEATVANWDQFGIEYPEWIARHSKNVRVALDNSAKEYNVEFCAFYDFEELFHGRPMPPYPSFEERKQALADTKGNPAEDFVGSIAGMQERLASKGITIRNYGNALYHYNLNPVTKKIWWDEPAFFRRIWEKIKNTFNNVMYTIYLN